MRLGATTSSDLLGRAELRLVIPLGATEQHGPHLPLETDTVIAGGIALALAAVRADVIVAPPLAYGSSGEHAGFPGTLSIGQSALEEVVVELVRSAENFRDVTLLAWHGGNAEPLTRAIDRLRCERRRVDRWEPHVEGGDAHAGWVETSLMLVLAPELVREARPLGVTAPLERLLPRLRQDGVKAVAENGVLGDARSASDHVGRGLLARLVADLNDLLGS